MCESPDESGLCFHVQILGDLSFCFPNYRRFLRGDILFENSLFGSFLLGDLLLNGFLFLVFLDLWIRIEFRLFGGLDLFRLLVEALVFGSLEDLHLSGMLIGGLLFA